jgi:hypothetical protein
MLQPNACVDINIHRIFGHTGNYVWLGITDSVPCCAQASRMASVSHALSASKFRYQYHLTGLATIRCRTCCNQHSGRYPSRIHGQMYFVEPLLCDSWSDYHGLHRQRANELRCGWRRPSAIHSSAHQSIVSAELPRSFCPTNHSRGRGYFFSHRNWMENPVRERRCATSINGNTCIHLADVMFELGLVERSYLSHQITHS